MNTFKKKSLCAALAGASALGLTDVAQAVNLNPDGLGQVLLYPYYTTRRDGTGLVGHDYATLLSVVNSTGSVKAVKVRFLEGKNSREVLDFNLFLSPYDVWTAAILPDNTTGGAQIGTYDKSCTLPPFTPGVFVPFVNYAYFGSTDVDDKGGGSLDRTREGYFEIIEMATYSPGTTTAIAATHVNGVPPCGADINDVDAANEADPPQGGLFGGASLINVLSGTDYTEDAVALDNFCQGCFLYFPAGVTLPDLTQAAPPVSVVVANNSVYTSNWSPGTADPVSAVLMHNTVLNEYVLDTGTASGTDWVVTFPTKRFYVNVGTGNAPRLFQRNFNTTAGSCDDVGLAIWDREEVPQLITNFSPPPPTPGASICWEANVITFKNSNVLGSVNVSNVVPRFQNGWMRLSFPTTTSTTLHKLSNTATDITFIGQGTSTGQTVTYVGLPVIGFMVQSFSNGTLPGGGPLGLIQSSYGGNFKHKHNTLILD